MKHLLITLSVFLLSVLPYQAIAEDARPGDSPAAFPGQKSEWNGYDRYDFTFKGRDAIVVTPKEAAEGRPWIWRPAFFNDFPFADIALLGEGFYVVYYDETHRYGSPASIASGNEFYYYMTSTYNLSQKVVLEGLSRGGLFIFNWAAANPDRVACIYGDAPVCDPASWPGPRSKTLWKDFLNNWDLLQEDYDKGEFQGRPLDNAAIISKAGIPVFSVCGDSDRVVPYVNNMKLMREELMKNGSPVELILKPGVDHHPHSLEQPKPIVDYILRTQPLFQSRQFITKRGEMNNSFAKFEKSGSGKIRLIGDDVEALGLLVADLDVQLRQRFPDCNFQFITSAPAKGRFQIGEDVDLIFIENSVNLQSRGLKPEKQVSEMERLLQSIRSSNPYADIVILHFDCESFDKSFQDGIAPDVILNVERAANRFKIPTVDMAHEMAVRKAAGESLSKGTEWYRIAAVERLLDLMWHGCSPDKERIAH